MSEELIPAADARTMADNANKEEDERYKNECQEILCELIPRMNRAIKAAAVVGKRYEYIVCNMKKSQVSHNILRIYIKNYADECGYTIDDMDIRDNTDGTAIRFNLYW